MGNKSAIANMSDNEEIEVEAVSGYQVLPKEVTAEIGTIKLFNKWSYEDVEIRDISLTDYIQIRTPSKLLLTPLSTADPAKTLPVSVQLVPSVVKPSMSPLSAVSTKPSPSSQSVPARPPSETSSLLLSAWLRS